MSFISVVGLTLAMVSAPPPTDRTEAIWSFAQARMMQQYDVWFDLGDYPKVIQVLNFQNAIVPKDYEVATNLGWMHENVEDYPSAISTYRQYMKDNPQDPDASFPLANLYSNQRKFELVIPLLEPAIQGKVHPHPNSYRILARSYERLNRLKDSQRVWQTYIRLAPDDLSAKANLRRVEGKLAKK